MTGRAALMSSTTLELDHASAVPLYRQIYERLCRVVLDGQLKIGERLPSTRELASKLGVSRHTVFIAYEQLLAEMVFTCVCAGSGAGNQGGRFKADCRFAFDENRR